MNFKRDKGFTLFEILVVIAIIAILTAIVSAAYGTMRAKGRDANRIADVKQIKVAIDDYFVACREFPPAPLSDVLPIDRVGTAGCSGYVPTLNSFPEDPLGSSHSAYKYFVDNTNDGPNNNGSRLGKYYHICATLELEYVNNQQRAGYENFETSFGTDDCDGTDPYIFDLVGGVY